MSNRVRVFLVVAALAAISVLSMRAAVAQEEVNILTNGDFHEAPNPRVGGARHPNGITLGVPSGSTAIRGWKAVGDITLLTDFNGEANSMWILLSGGRCGIEQVAHLQPNQKYVLSYWLGDDGKHGITVTVGGQQQAVNETGIHLHQWIFVAKAKDERISLSTASGDGHYPFLTEVHLYTYDEKKLAMQAIANKLYSTWYSAFRKRDYHAVEALLSPNYQFKTAEGQALGSDAFIARLRTAGSRYDLSGLSYELRKSAVSDKEINATVVERYTFSANDKKHFRHLYKMVFSQTDVWVPGAGGAWVKKSTQALPPEYFEDDKKIDEAPIKL